MTILARRLSNSGLSRIAFERPEAVVAWLAAVQAQDYAGAAWGLGQRTVKPSELQVHQAFDGGQLLRTHMLRPTWHFVTPADIVWIQALTGPRVQAGNASLYRKLDLDARTLARSRDVVERALAGRNWQTRTELAATLSRKRIRASGIRLAYIVMHAELDAVICSGPRRGKQFTYGLVAERAPAARPLDRETALAELARRYVRSHGPATVRDFSWWSGLTMREAKAAFASIAPELDRAVKDGLTYWFVPGQAPAPPRTPVAYLLPNYDEFLIAHRDRRLATSDAPAGVKDRLPYHLIVDGRLAGCWRPRVGPREAVVEVAAYRRLKPADRAAVATAAANYGRFLGLPVRLSLGVC